MVTLRLAQRVPKCLRRLALEPDQNKLGDVRNDIKHGNEYKTAADFRVYLKEHLG